MWASGLGSPDYSPPPPPALRLFHLLAPPPLFLSVSSLLLREILSAALRRSLARSLPRPTASSLALVCVARSRFLVWPCCLPCSADRSITTPPPPSSSFVFTRFQVRVAESSASFASSALAALLPTMSVAAVSFQPQYQPTVPFQQSLPPHLANYPFRASQASNYTPVYMRSGSSSQSTASAPIPARSSSSAASAHSAAAPSRRSSTFYRQPPNRRSSTTYSSSTHSSASQPRLLVDSLPDLESYVSDALAVQEAAAASGATPRPYRIESINRSRQPSPSPSYRQPPQRYYAALRESREARAAAAAEAAAADGTEKEKDSSPSSYSPSPRQFSGRFDSPYGSRNNLPRSGSSASVSSKQSTPHQQGRSQPARPARRHSFLGLPGERRLPKREPYMKSWNASQPEFSRRPSASPSPPVPPVPSSGLAQSTTVSSPERSKKSKGMLSRLFLRKSK